MQNYDNHLSIEKYENIQIKINKNLFMFFLNKVTISMN